MKRSNNLYAQMMFLNVGAASDLPVESGDSTSDRANAALNRFLNKAGVKESGVYLQEGSGLARGDLLNADAVTQLLVYMRKHKDWPSFYASLPEAGKDGTLSSRMKETVAEGNVRAKTGTLRFVYSLSGYAKTAGGEEVAFSILLNHFRTSSRWEARQAVDRLAVIICESP